MVYSVSGNAREPVVVLKRMTKAAAVHRIRKRRGSVEGELDIAAGSGRQWRCNVLD